MSNGSGSRSARAATTRSPTATSTSSAAPHGSSTASSSASSTSRCARRRRCSPPRSAGSSSSDAIADLPQRRGRGLLNLLVDFAREHGARRIVKGLRAISDFEYEFEMNQLNRKLAPEIESVYVIASPDYSFLSSTGVKEMATFGGDVSRPRAGARSPKRCASVRSSTEAARPAPGAAAIASLGGARTRGQELAARSQKPASSSQSVPGRVSFHDRIWTSSSS